MRIKIGTDICSIKRVEDAYNKFGNRFLAKILRPGEINYVLAAKSNPASRIAARFAAKEAAAKALGVGFRGIGWKDVEVTRRDSGEPGLVLHDRAAQVAMRRGLERFEVTLSHERDFAVAFVIAWADGSEK